MSLNQVFQIMQDSSVDTVEIKIAVDANGNPTVLTQFILNSLNNIEVKGDVADALREALCLPFYVSPTDKDLDLALISELNQARESLIDVGTEAQAIVSNADKVKAKANEAKAKAKTQAKTKATTAQKAKKTAPTKTATMQPVAENPVEAQETVEPVAEKPVEAQETVEPVAEKPVEAQETVEPVAEKPVETQETVESVAEKPVETQETVEPVVITLNVQNPKKDQLPETEESEQPEKQDSYSFSFFNEN